MQLLLPPEVTARIITALKSAARREIGGILMGEHVAEGVFRVKDLTIQRRGGTFASFVRIVQEIIGPLRSFFRTTNEDFMRFNYLGEWHSHPSFDAVPSEPDHETMRDIIEDPEVGANFVVLMVVKLNHGRRFEGTVTVYQPSGRQYRGALILEGNYE
jgi:[CysO sulfur-carrier protein]-S-L-cysteine hydrolase